MKKPNKKKSETILTVEDFKVGDFVHHRTWTVPAAGKQEPVVSKRVMKIVHIYGDDITCGGNKSFAAFELIKSSWKPTN